MSPQKASRWGGPKQETHEARSPWMTVIVHLNGQLEEIKNRLGEGTLGVRVRVSETGRQTDRVSFSINPPTTGGTIPSVGFLGWIKRRVS